MKFLASKVLIISVAVGVLVIGGLLLAQRRQVQPKPQPRRYPHVHLNSSAWEPKAKLPNETYTLRKGDTLVSVARLRYGHQNYHGVIKVYNHIPDETQIKVGSTLRLPDMSAILAEECFAKVAGPELELILCSRAKYDGVVDQLWTLPKDTDGNRVVPEGVSRELLEAADDLQQATEALQTSRSGVSGVPKKMIRQLEQSMSGMRELAGGTNPDSSGYDINLVQQRYGLALEYAIIWAREGFK